MSYFGSTQWYQRVAAGLVPKHSLVHKFGAGTLTSTISPITNSGVYRTPTTAVALEVVSSSANDTSAGTGARTVTIIGLNSSWEEITETVTMNGTTAVATVNSYTRVYRWYVATSGSYATQITGSHVGTLTLRVAAGGDTWSTLVTTPFAVGQSQIGQYTVPAGYEAYLLSKSVFVDSTKAADVYFFKRTNTDTVAAPFSPLRLVDREVGITSSYSTSFVSPRYLGAGPMDVGFMGKVATGTGECSVDFELLLIET